ncbi:virginiamycin A acetyltransferase [Glycomyces artemisiae]|uniref:Virginiamycin A acetyltransferase n=2 Tax=Glycomyces artemisiae TaxID=1076443 RepID=A0A2T0UP22_9ACTN|nr:CatB-related O-acetyltransferase [Glycomyces artemisiae]PRY59675.1 virginiamycin A acetyltransferase [Glycomyces artemisiae]
MIPDPTVLHPMAGQPRVVFLKPLIESEKIEVGEYTYYDDPDAATAFEERNVLYSYGPEKLRIGRYCALATGTRFLMAGADHPMVGVSTFPFAIFGGDWTESTLDIVMNVESRGDTTVGNDVWLGYNTTVMPGVTIGDGAIIASGAVVTADVPPYTIVGGNPAKPIRKRFGDEEIELLLRAAWWDWPAELVTEHARTIMSGTPADVFAIAEANGLT